MENDKIQRIFCISLKIIFIYMLLMFLYINVTWMKEIVQCLIAFGPRSIDITADAFQML